jgi:hypothetical protein
MKTRSYKQILIGLLLVAFSATAVSAFSAGSILKLGGVAALVDYFKKPINDQINKTLGERGAAARGATKVVPILSVGTGGYVGAAQVVGVPSAVNKTQAVVAIEIPAGSFRATGYLPVSTKNALKSPERLPNVGVSAVVDFKL